MYCLYPRQLRAQLRPSVGRVPGQDLEEADEVLVEAFLRLLGLLLHHHALHHFILERHLGLCRHLPRKGGFSCSYISVTDLELILLMVEREKDTKSVCACDCMCQSECAYAYLVRIFAYVSKTERGDLREKRLA